MLITRNFYINTGMTNFKGMNPAKLSVLLFLLVASLFSKSQTSLTHWKNYSINQTQFVKSPAFSLETFKEQEQISLRAFEYTNNDELEWINNTVNSISYINSNRTVLGSKFHEPIFAIWNIYKDYYSQDSFEYQDLDVEETH